MKIGIVRVKDSLWDNMPDGVESISPYGKFNIFTRFCIKYLQKFSLIQNIIYNRSLKNSNLDTLIVFDSISKYFLKWLQKHNGDKRIILWYWNPAYLTIDPNDVPEGIEKWSYSMTDCKKYGMNYNTQFCFPKYGEKLLNLPTEYDVFFLGRDKGRAEFILDCEKKLKNAGIKTEFLIIEKGEYLQYDEVLQRTAKAKCILDICVRDDVGMSLRALEALFLNKKVITNNKMYVYEKFYRPENVFILGVDDETKLADFIDSPMALIEYDIKKQYLFDNWILQFKK